jgi:hypothetical protein
MNSTLSRLWQRLLRRIGIEGLIGLFLVSAAVGLVVWAMRLDRLAVQTLSQAESRQRAAGSESRNRSQAPSPQQSRREFIDRFPPPSQNAADLSRVFEAAAHSNLVLTKGEYHVVTESQSPFVTYVATFPVKDSYANVRDFATEVLRSLPHAALEEMRLERGNSTATVLDARVRINLFYRAP